MNPQRLGIIIATLSIMTIAILVYAEIQTNNYMKESCELVHGKEYASVCPYHQAMSMTLWIPIIASVLIGSLGGIGIYLALSKNEKFIEKKEYDLSKLQEEEKKLFYRIQQEKKGVYQSVLTKEYNVSKVHMTRLLDKLEGFGLIERKRRGLTNIVVAK